MHKCTQGIFCHLFLDSFSLSRHALKMNPNNAELERVSNSSAESLSSPFRTVHVSFTAGSSDSLDSDTQTGSDGRK